MTQKRIIEIGERVLRVEQLASSDEDLEAYHIASMSEVTGSGLSQAVLADPFFRFVSVRALWLNNVSLTDELRFLVCRWSQYDSTKATAYLAGFKALATKHDLQHLSAQGIVSYLSGNIFDPEALDILLQDEETVSVLNNPSNWSV